MILLQSKLSVISLMISFYTSLGKCYFTCGRHACHRGKKNDDIKKIYPWSCTSLGDVATFPISFFNRTVFLELVFKKGLLVRLNQNPITQITLPPIKATRKLLDQLKHGAKYVVPSINRTKEITRWIIQFVQVSQLITPNQSVPNQRYIPATPIIIHRIEFIYVKHKPTRLQIYQTGAVQPGCVACSGADRTDRELQCGPSGPYLVYLLLLLC